MELPTLKLFGQIAGIGGLALGIFLLLFRDVIRKNIFPTLSPEHAYRLIRQFMYLTFAIAAIGVLSWIFQGDRPTSTLTSLSITFDTLSKPKHKSTKVVVAVDGPSGVKVANLSPVSEQHFDANKTYGPYAFDIISNVAKADMSNWTITVHMDPSPGSITRSEGDLGV